MKQNCGQNGRIFFCQSFVPCLLPELNHQTSNEFNFRFYRTLNLKIQSFNAKKIMIPFDNYLKLNTHTHTRRHAGIKINNDGY